jgi:hypothetical protein
MAPATGYAINESGSSTKTRASCYAGILVDTSHGYRCLRPRGGLVDVHHAGVVSQTGQAQARRAQVRRGAGRGSSGPWGRSARERVTACSGLTCGGLVLGTTGAAAVVAALLAPKVLLTNFKLNKPGYGPGSWLG